MPMMSGPIVPVMMSGPIVPIVLYTSYDEEPIVRQL